MQFSHNKINAELIFGIFTLKVDKRPKITERDDENENISDREAAKKAWNIHLSINNSIIVDLFQVNLLYVEYNI